MSLSQLLTGRFGRKNGIKRVRIETCVPRLCGHGHGRRREVLYLFELEVHVFREDGQLGHVFLVTSGMRRNEVGDDLLAQVFLAVDAVEDALELSELTERRFAHEHEHAVAGVLGGHFESSADVARDEFAGILHGRTVGRLVLALI